MKENETGWQSNNLKGKPKTISTNCYSVINESGEVRKGEIYSREKFCRFDNKGNLIEM